MMDHPRPIRCLITGEGNPSFTPDFPLNGGIYTSLNDHEENPAFVIARDLEGTFLQQSPMSAYRFSNTHFAARETHPVLISSLLEPVPVVYEEVTTLVSMIHKLPYELIIHLGLGPDNGVHIEECGRKSAYRKKDSNNRHALFPYSSFAPEDDPLPHRISTKFNVPALVDVLKREHGKHIYASHDAGLYLNEYLYFLSLLEALKPRANLRSRPWVLLVQVPLLDDPARLPAPYSLEELKQIIIKLVWTAAQIVASAGEQASFAEDYIFK